MNQKEIKELIELLVEKDITEFEIERGDVKLHIKRGGEAHAPQMLHVAAAAPVAAPVSAPPPTVSVAAEAAKPAAGLRPLRRLTRTTCTS